jgi:Helicase conserved C-terminal domain
LKNLLGRLMSRPLDELRSIAASWGTLTRDASPSQNDLAIAAYHTMVDPSAVRAIWENTEVEDRAFLSWLINQRNMLTIVDDLPGLIDRPPDETSALLERLRRIGLVDVDEVMVRGSRVVSSGDNLYAWAARNNSEAVPRRVVSIATEAAKVLRDVIEESKRPAPFDEPFHALLENHEQADIQRIASTWKLPEAARYYKSELIGIMSEFLATGQGKTILLNSLTPAAQGLFTYIESEGGKAPAGAIKKQFGWGERELRAASIGLIQRALVWDALHADRRYLFIPRDLLKGGQSGPARLPAYAQPKLDAPAPHTVLSRYPYEMAWDILTLMSEASHTDLQLTLQDTRITKRVAKKVNESFLQPEDLKTGSTSEYVDVVVHMAQALGLLVERQSEHPALTLSPRSEEWAKHTFEAQRRRLFGLWLEDRKWSEPATYGTIYWWNSDLTGARKRLVKHLMALPTMKWISLDGFLKSVHMAEPFIIWGQDELVRRYGLRALQGFRSQWYEIEGRIVADMIRTMLHWLGAVDLGRDKQKRLLSFRLTESAHALLDPENQRTEGTSARDAQPSILVQPNFEVLVLHPDSRVLWTLVRMSDLVRHDRVSVYNINKESVLRAVEGGLQASEMVAFLNKNMGKHLPQNVAQSISDWARLIKRAHIHRATLIEVDDPAILDEMLAGRKTRKLVLKRLSPTVAVAALPGVGDTARDDPWQRLMKDLRGAGYVPHFSSEIVPEETGRQKDDGNGHKAGAASASSNGMAAQGSANAHSNGTSEGQTAGTTRRRKSSSRTSA